MTRGIVCAAAFSLALGCAAEGPRWVKPGASDADREAAMDACMSKATIAGDYANPQDRARVERDLENCMTARGWRRAPRD